MNNSSEKIDKENFDNISNSYVEFDERVPNENYKG